MKRTLSAEQSATLIAKGISADKASERTPDYKDINNTGKPFERRELLPIFTLPLWLVALLDLAAFGYAVIIAYAARSLLSIRQPSLIDDKKGERL